MDGLGWLTDERDARRASTNCLIGWLTYKFWYSICLCFEFSNFDGRIQSQPRPQPSSSSSSFTCRCKAITALPHSSRPCNSDVLFFHRFFERANRPVIVWDGATMARHPTETQWTEIHRDVFMLVTTKIVCYRIPYIMHSRSGPVHSTTVWSFQNVQYIYMKLQPARPGLAIITKTTKRKSKYNHRNAI